MTRARCILVLAVAFASGDGATLVAQPAAKPAPETLPDGALWRLGSARLRHVGAVQQVSFTADGKHLASVGDDQVLSIWDLRTGAEVRQTRFARTTPRGDVTQSLANLRLLIQLGRVRSRVSVLDVATELAPDGKTLVLSSAGKVRILDLLTQKEITKLAYQDTKVGLTATSADGKLLARFISNDERETDLTVAEVPGGKVRHKLRLSPMEHLHLLCFSRDARYVAGANLANQISLWDLVSGKRIRRYEMNEPVTDLCFTPRGNKLVSASSQNIAFWDLASVEEAAKIPTGDIPACAIAISPDGKLLAATGKNHAILICDVAKAAVVHQLAGLPADAVALTFSADGHRLASATSEGAIHLWDLKSMQQTTPVEHRPKGVPIAFFAPDRLLVRSGMEGALHRVEASTGKLLRVLTPPKNENAGVLAIAPDGRRSAQGDQESGNVRIWDNEKNVELHKLEGHVMAVAWMQFSPDGSFLATMTQDKNLRIWNVAVGKKVHSLETSVNPGNQREFVVNFRFREVQQNRNSTPQLVFSQDNRFLAVVGLTTLVSLVELATGTERGRFQLGGAPIAQLLLSPDGRLMATLSSDDVVRVWDTAHGKLVHGFVHDGELRTAAFSSSSKLLAVGDSDGAVVVYDLVEGKERRRFNGHRAAVNAVLFAPAGGPLLSSGDDGAMFFWDVNAPFLPAPLATLPADTRVAHLWDKLGSAEAAQAYAAIDELSLHPAAAVKLLRKKLKPATPADPARLQRLIADLRSANYAVREKASHELIRFDMEATPTLSAALRDSPGVETRRRIEKALEAVEAQRATAENLRAVRAMEVLERIGSTEASVLVETLAAGAPHARLTLAAKETLPRFR